MAPKKNLETGNLKLEAMLADAGFKNIDAPAANLLYARNAPDFNTAHAAVLQTVCNCPDYLGCSRFEQSSGPVLIVHRKPLPAPKKEVSCAD